MINQTKSAQQNGKPPMIMTHAEQIDGCVRVTWSDGDTSRFPLRWLRYECVCNECGDSRTGIRFITPPALPKDLALTRCSVNAGGGLELQWAPGGHESVYERDWLYEHRLSSGPSARRVHRPTTWGSELSTELAHVSFDEFMTADARRCDALEAIRDFGVVHVVDGPVEQGTAERIANRIGPLEETNFGRVFELQSAENATSIGATRKPASLHTDEPYRNMPTGIKVIHCLQTSDAGTGTSLFADGFRLGELLQEQAPALFELLCTQPITFHRRYPDAIVTATAPIFCRHDGRLHGFRFQDRSMAPLDMDLERVDAVLDAVTALMGLIADPSNQLRLRLEPGQAVLFDNHRLLHGRTGFSGARRLQLCSVNRDTFLSAMRVLQRDLGRPGPYDSIASGA